MRAWPAKATRTRACSSGFMPVWVNRSGRSRRDMFKASAGIRGRAGAGAGGAGAGARAASQRSRSMWPRGNSATRRLASRQRASAWARSVSVGGASSCCGSGSGGVWAAGVSPGSAARKASAGVPASKGVADKATHSGSSRKRCFMFIS